MHSRFRILGCAGRDADGRHCACAHSRIPRQSGQPMTDRIETADIREWQPVLRPDSATRLIDAVEDGKIVYLPQLRFALSDSELRFLDPATLGDKAKSLAFDPASGTLKHARADHAEIAAMMRRYAGAAHGLMCSLLPRYASALG